MGSGTGDWWSAAGPAENGKARIRGLGERPDGARPGMCRTVRSTRWAESALTPRDGFSERHLPRWSVRRCTQCTTMYSARLRSSKFPFLTCICAPPEPTRPPRRAAQRSAERSSQQDMPKAQRSRACQQCRERRVKVWYGPASTTHHIVRLLQIC